MTGRLACVLGLACALAACQTPQPQSEGAAAALEGQTNTAAEADAARGPIPDRADALLAELLPLPPKLQALEVHYAITGPALAGELSTLIAPGGLRRDRWELRSTAGHDLGDNEELRAVGLTIINAEDIWTGHDGGPGERRANHLGELARAYLELAPEARGAVVESIRAWHQTLAEQRARHGGERAEVLGVSCLQTRVAAQNVCMWEEAGLLLRYEGAAFTIEATKIDRAPVVEADSFALPGQAASVERTASAERQDYASILAELAGGSYAQVSVLVLGAKGIPELRLPTADPDP